jgi:hypothetical protein
MVAALQPVFPAGARCASLRPQDLNGHAMTEDVTIGLQSQVGVSRVAQNVTRKGPLS